MAHKKRKFKPGLPASRTSTETTVTSHPVTSLGGGARSRHPSRGAGFLQSLGVRLKEYAGLAGDATYLWPRWLLLRVIGVVYLCVFAGIIKEGHAMVGPNGILPLAESLAHIREKIPGAFDAFRWAPSLFWLNSGSAMITALSWLGFTAAVALVLNLWPRMMLFVCWSFFLSFVSTWNNFSPAQIDRLMIETALLCIPFAPRGLRPGLGADSPPPPIALFTMRWLLFRLMFESGLVKATSEDPHWQNFTAMDIMYETSPVPTVLGYWAHKLPHAYHVFEIVFTYAAELLGPVLAVFCGRWGRWIALVLWVMLQAGIQLTGNFGWLNTAAIGLGLLFLDDQMLASAVGKLRLHGLRDFLAKKAAALSQTPSTCRAAWRKYGLRVALLAHFGLTLPYFAEACGLFSKHVPDSPIFAPVDFFGGFWSANGYYFFSSFDPLHVQVDFEGSNDGGRTWRTYEYRYLPQRVDRMPGFISPRFARFENTIYIEGTKTTDTPLLPRIAAQLLSSNADVIAQFKRDPFQDRPPTVMRMRRYRLSYTDTATLAETGHYWKKEFDADYAPAMYKNERGEILQFNLSAADAALKKGNTAQAFQVYEEQFSHGNLEAGFRLAHLYSRGIGVSADRIKALALFSDLAARGEVRALHQLGVSYEFGEGVPVDYVKAAALYEEAADKGLLHSLYALGTMSARDRLIPRNDIEGLSRLLRAAERASREDSSIAAFIREDYPNQVRRLTERMSPADISTARAKAGLP